MRDDYDHAAHSSDDHPQRHGPRRCRDAQINAVPHCRRPTGPSRCAPVYPNAWRRSFSRPQTAFPSGRCSSVHDRRPLPDPPDLPPKPVGICTGSGVWAFGAGAGNASDSPARMDLLLVGSTSNHTASPGCSPGGGTAEGRAKALFNRRSGRRRRAWPRSRGTSSR
jgi:hypothetical protein